MAIPPRFAFLGACLFQALVASRELIEMESAEVERDLADLDVSFRHGRNCIECLIR